MQHWRPRRREDQMDAWMDEQMPDFYYTCFSVPVAPDYPSYSSLLPSISASSLCCCFCFFSASPPLWSIIHITLWLPLSFLCHLKPLSPLRGVRTHQRCSPPRKRIKWWIKDEREATDKELRDEQLHVLHCAAWHFTQSCDILEKSLVPSRSGSLDRKCKAEYLLPRCGSTMWHLIPEMPKRWRSNVDFSILTTRSEVCVSSPQGPRMIQIEELINLTPPSMNFTRRTVFPQGP